MTPSGIERATFRFVAQCLNELRTAFERRVIPHVVLSVCLCMPARISPFERIKV